MAIQFAEGTNHHWQESENQLSQVVLGDFRRFPLALDQHKKACMCHGHTIEPQGYTTGTTGVKELWDTELSPTVQEATKLLDLL